MGPATVRGQRTGGVVEAARTYLATIDLRQFGTSSAPLFRRRLDRATETMARALPRGAQSWGVARKLLNIFLLQALYTHYLRKTFRLDRAEHLFELPIDSIIAKQLRGKAGRGALPRWRGVKRISPEVSIQYQAAAAAIAAARGIARVHLDAFWWGSRR